MSTLLVDVSLVTTYTGNMSIKRHIVTMKWNPDIPYDHLPMLPPSTELETKAVLKQCVKSRTAVERINQAVDHLPNPSLLINILPLLEARASSEIENIVTTSDAMFKSSLLEGGATDPATKEAMSYREALYAGFKNISERPLSTITAEHICSVIKGVEMRVRAVPGTTLCNEQEGKTIYTPPVGEDLIREKLSNWERFIHGELSDLDPLVVIAVSHYQFEAIHPFTDGNGRTGRVLNLLQLVSSGLLSLPILYHSRSIIRRKSEYYENLNRVTSHDEWEKWVLYMLETIEEAADWTFKKIQEIRALRREVKNDLRERYPRFYSSELIDVLFNQPYCRIQDMVEAGIAKRQAASTYLKELVSYGLLAEEKVGREKLFVHKKYLILLLNES